MTSAGLCSMCQHGTTRTVTCRGCSRVFCRHLWYGAHCTNSVCLDCHAKHCTPGGATEPGHIYRGPGGMDF